ncbi:hypothetical protein BCV70DRAFT_9208 [Testicularia cyperi]|uniref:Uncharacterized protein n=1 Tax=Testicularia cyperi TaxID=1882483 RepID=A0A317Y027_9BASI|nr:hypothetical protein BCV70DRAFT_9208 [Testicularia cyperi]
MFSVVLPGRLPLTAPQQVDETHCIFPLEDASSISHVVVFMTGVQPFPAGYSATVHLLWPSSPSAASSGAGAGAAQEPKWQLLGCLRNTKPSSIFKIRAPSAGVSAGAPQPGLTATLGISIEPDHLVDSQIATLPSASSSTSASTALTPFGQQQQQPPQPQPQLQGQHAGSSAGDAQTQALTLAPKIAKNAFAYLSSFAPDSAPQTVPLLQKWLEQLERKLRAQGVGFLDKQD